LVFETEKDRERADWALLHNGPITLFWREGYFAKAKDDLTALGYLLIEASCRSAEHLQVEISAGLRWFDQFGYAPWNGSLDPLYDAFFGLPPSLGDVAICLEHFHEMVDREPSYAAGLLDVLASGSWQQLLRGRRFIVLVQTDDAKFHSEPLGGMRANWSEAEWLNEHRGL
jgi:hypothetical protein